MSYLTEQEVAELTRLSVCSLRNDRCQRRRIPFIKIGKSVRYSKDDVIAFMEAHRVDMTTTPERA